MVEQRRNSASSSNLGDGISGCSISNFNESGIIVHDEYQFFICEDTITAILDEATAFCGKYEYEFSPKPEECIEEFEEYYRDDLCKLCQGIPINPQRCISSEDCDLYCLSCAIKLKNADQPC